MLKQLNLFLGIIILILVIIVSFENLFFSKGSYYILFWQMDGSATWLIVGTFLLGMVFGLNVSSFLHSSPESFENDSSSLDNDPEWK